MAWDIVAPGDSFSIVAKLILFNKPYGVLSQFSGEANQQTLANYIDVPGVYAAGRLDKDSEGLLLLTDDGGLQHRIAEPRHKQWKIYLIQVEGEASQEAIVQLQSGVELKDGPALPARAKTIPDPGLWPRDPPIRQRRHIPTSWVRLEIQEGRNRQVRHMTAAVGFPTLRLVRVQVGRWQLGDLQPGQWQLTEA